MNRRERRAGARESRKPHKNAGASTPDTLHQSGLRHMRAERYLDAQLCCQQALAMDSAHPPSLHLMGLLALRADQHTHAVEWFSRAIGASPRAEYVSSLGAALQRSGRMDEALKAFDKAVQLKPHDTENWNNLANFLLELKNTDAALQAYRHVLTLNPRHGHAIYRCGVILRTQGRLEEALSYLNRCDELHPNDPVVLNQRGHALHSLKRFEEALADHRRAQARHSTNPDFCVNLGVALNSLHREEEALPYFDTALALRPNYVAALNCKALALVQLGRLEEATAIFRRVREMDPDDAEAGWSLSLLDLMTGNFEAGWAGREVRWNGHMRPVSYPKFSQPMWLGDTDIDGKTLLVYPDEGLGDTIQFARYVPMLAALGAKVVLVVQDSIYPLMRGLAGISQYFAKSAPLPPFDLHCAICSLPMAFKTRLDTIPSGSSYLPQLPAALVQTWEARLQKRLGPRSKLRVGLVWSGNPEHGNDHNRSVPLRTLAKITNLDADFISLQKDLRPGDKETRAQTRIVDLTSHLADFSETAALVNCLDLVITVDTSVAHLAAALGRPTWILIPHVPDYRWLLDREDSPWYPSVRLFRQTRTRDYEGVIERVKSELLGMIAARQS